MSKTIVFHETECEIVFDKYRKDNSPAIMLTEAGTGEPVTTATVWVEGLAKDEVAIKNYSENAGIYPLLVKADVVESSHRKIESGFAVLPVCRLKQTDN